MKKTLLYIPALLLLSSIAYSQAPNLGTATVFTFFTANGAFTNTGASTVTGDIGTNAGLYTGFPPGTLNGTAHIADATSAQAALDVNAAYTQISSNACGVVLGTTLGSEQVLTANTYCLGASSTLNGNIVLDGQNNPAALFIFKIGGAFSSGINASVTLINGASAKNIYWQVGGQITLGDNTIFKGTILADGAIILLNGASLTGRGLSINGAISLNNNVAMQDATVLAVNLLRFDAQARNRQVIVSWTTATEQNSNRFIIERSNAANTNFTTAGTVSAATNSSVAVSYSFVDNDAASGLNYYRLISQSLNGTRTTSKTIAVNIKADAETISVYPNPMQNSVMVKGAANNSTIQLTDINGKNILTRQLTAAGNNTIETFRLQPGIYFLSATNVAGQKNTVKVVKL